MTDRTAPSPADERPAPKGTLQIVWAVLVVATALAWFVGDDHGFGEGDAAIAGLLAITFLKVWMVGRWFMGLRGAPTVLQRLFDAYVVVIPSGLFVLYLAT